MAVRPLRINPNGTVEVYHDELNHGGTVALSDLAHATDREGNVDPAFLVLPCPACATVTIHPASGGAAPHEVQRLFAHKFKAHGVPQRPDAAGKKRPPKSVKDWKEAKDNLRSLVEAQDGPGRWLLEQVEEGG